MFEFNGWINIECDDSDDADLSVLDRRLNLLCDEIEHSAQNVFRSSNRHFHLYRTLNATSKAIFCGAHNHRDSSVIEWFEQIAKNQSWSYGKLYVRDDEDQRGFQNCMRVFTMARGVLYEDTDSRMSPCIPSIEPEITLS